MIRRILATAAALAVGSVALGPVGSAVVYGLEGFPVEADAKGAVRFLSAVGALVLIAVGAAAGMALPATVRGWPTVAAGLLAGGLLVHYAPLDPDSPFGELHPLARLVAALVAGVVVGACVAAVLPARPATGDPWPVGGLAAGIVVGEFMIPGLTPPLTERTAPGWFDIFALVLAIAAAVVIRTPAVPTSGTRAVTYVALAGAAVAAAFHTQYAGRATEGASAAVVAIVLVATAALWIAATAALVWWSGRRAGPSAARFALCCAGASAAFFVSSGRAAGIVWSGVHTWAPLLAIAAGVTGVLVTRHRPAVPWDAFGIGAAALATLVLVVAPPGDDFLFFGASLVVAAFGFGAALARTSAAGALCGLLALLLTVPLMFGVADQLDNLLRADSGTELGRLSSAVLYAPLWLGAVVVAILLARRERPTAGRSTLPVPA